jgi:histidine kinase-like protein
VVVVGASTSQTVLLRQFLASKESMAVARQAVGAELGRQGLAHLADNARLITDELFMNALKAARMGSVIKVSLDRSHDGVTLAVWDCNTSKPYLRPSLGGELGTAVTPDERALDPDHFTGEIGGWGLRLVAGLSDRNWVSYTDNPHGKWVCALLNF